jgi:hypothetical protein
MVELRWCPRIIAAGLTADVGLHEVLHYPKSFFKETFVDRPDLCCLACVNSEC